MAYYWACTENIMGTIGLRVGIGLTGMLSVAQRSIPASSSGPWAYFGKTAAGCRRVIFIWIGGIVS